MSVVSIDNNTRESGDNLVQKISQKQLQTECLSCRIIGSGSLAAVGLYSLNMSRSRAPGSLTGKRIMAGLGVCFLVASAWRWTSTRPQ